MNVNRAAKAATILFLTALVITGCGRKGALDVPAGGTTVQNEDGSETQPDQGRRFILDPLID